MSYDRSKKARTNQANIRLKDNDFAMLERLCNTYNASMATIMRMALKYFYDKTFKEEER